MTNDRSAPTPDDDADVSNIDGAEDAAETDLAQQDGAEDTSSAQPSVASGLHDLFGDGRNYLEAEWTFQKSRMGYAADSGRWGLIYGLGALAFLHLALIALVVGLVIALMPILGAWGALGAVVGTLLFLTIALALMAKSRFSRIGRAFESKDEAEAGPEIESGLEAETEAEAEAGK